MYNPKKDSLFCLFYCICRFFLDVCLSIWVGSKRMFSLNSKGSVNYLSTHICYFICTLEIHVKLLTKVRYLYHKALCFWITDANSKHEQDRYKIDRLWQTLRNHCDYLVYLDIHLIKVLCRNIWLLIGDWLEVSLLVGLSCLYPGFAFMLGLNKAIECYDK